MTSRPLVSVMDSSSATVVGTVTLPAVFTGIFRYFVKTIRLHNSHEDSILISCEQHLLGQTLFAMFIH